MPVSTSLQGVARIGHAEWPPPAEMRGRAGAGSRLPAALPGEGGRNQAGAAAGRVSGRGGQVFAGDAPGGVGSSAVCSTPMARLVRMSMGEAGGVPNTPHT